MSPHAVISGAGIAGPALAHQLANPRTRRGIRALHAGAGLAAGPVGRAVAAVSRRGLGNIGGDPLALPDYSGAQR
jgi:hypothetical protein